MAKIKLRRDTYQNWYDANPVLALGEPAYDTSNNKIKIGDGASNWRDLSYLTDATGGSVNTGNFTFNNDTITNTNGMLLSTARGTLAIGTDLEVPGVPGHFHIAFDGSNLDPVYQDLFLGDDFNHVKIVGGRNGVEIGTDNGVGSSATWVFGTDRTLRLPNNVTQNTNPSVTCNIGMDTVIYTGSDQYQHTFKLLIKAEGHEVDNITQWETQSAEMIIAKSFNGDKVAASAYGVVHTSIDPLATFTARWNPTISRVEVLACPTSLLYPVEVRTFATEISTSD